MASLLRRKKKGCKPDKARKRNITVSKEARSVRFARKGSRTEKQREGSLGQTTKKQTKVHGANRRQSSGGERKGATHNKKRKELVFLYGFARKGGEKLSGQKKKKRRVGTRDEVRKMDVCERGGEGLRCSRAKKKKEGLRRTVAGFWLQRERRKGKKEGDDGYRCAKKKGDSQNSNDIQIWRHSLLREDSPK